MLFSVFLSCPALGPAVAGESTLVEADWVGTWRGELSIEGHGELPLVLRISRSDGEWVAKLDNPEQAAIGIPAGTVELREAHLDIRFPSIGGRYTAERTDRASVAGTWVQSGLTAPLAMSKVSDSPLVRNRPQTPEPPFPYRQEDVRFTSADGVALAGTLVTPKGEGPFPGVVLITGSGPQDRDETIAGHKPFRVLADYLARHNVASLRYDDRGAGASGGDFAAASFADFAADARAAAARLRRSDRIGWVGLAGHSEGGLVALEAAVRQPEVSDFLVLLATPAVPLYDVVIAQSELIAKAGGASETERRAFVSQQKEVLEIIGDDADRDDRRERIKTLLVERGLPEQVAARQARGWATDNFKYLLSMNPQRLLRQVQGPILVLAGDRDLQVPPAQNMPPMRRALADNPSARIHVFEGLNHLFQPAETGAPSEYAVIEQTLAPDVLSLMASWIASR